MMMRIKNGGMVAFCVSEFVKICMQLLLCEDTSLW